MGRAIAVGASLAAALLLWVWPAAGLAAAMVLLALLAPWGQRLGERVTLTTVAGLAALAVVFAVAWVVHVSIPLGAWRVLLTVVMVACAVVVRWRRGQVSVWPTVGRDDVVGIASGVVVGAALLVPLVGATPAQLARELLTFWDHSSHVPMLVQTVHAGGWDVSSLGAEPLFTTYPMLHVGVWSVAQWVVGANAQTSGVDLLMPYVVSGGLTAALVAALLTWAAASVARVLSPGGRGALFAAAVAAVWCVLGSLAAFVDFGFVNFLLSAGVVVGALAVGASSRPAMTAVGWWALPAAAVCGAYLYPPVAGGAVLAAVVWLIVLVRSRSRVALRLAAMSAAAAVVMLPAVRFVTEPFAQKGAGAFTGGLPPFPHVAAAVVVAACVVGLAVLRTPARHQRFALASVMVVVGVVGLLFAVQALRAGLPLGESYYTMKILYAGVLAAVPIGSALLARLAARWLPRGERRSWAAAATLVVITLLIGVGATVGGTWTSVRFGIPVGVPSGVWAAIGRVHRRGDGVQRGDVVIVAAGAQEPGWVVLPIVRGKARVPDGRMAAGLGGVLAAADEPARAAGLDGMAQALRADPMLRVRFVLDGGEVPAVIGGLIAEFGAHRVQVLASSASGTG